MVYQKFLNLKPAEHAALISLKRDKLFCGFFSCSNDAGSNSVVAGEVVGCVSYLSLSVICCVGFCAIMLGKTENSATAVHP